MMCWKKRLGICLAALALVLLAWAGLNLAVDPFGVLGGGVLRWDAYAQTLNSRTGKTAYLRGQFEEYDSYIIGSSAASAFSPEELNDYLDANFYNLFHTGADTDYDRALVSYLLKNDDVRYIVLVLGLEEADTAACKDFSLTQRGDWRVSGENAVSYSLRSLFASPGYAVKKLSAYRQDTDMPQAFDAFLPESGCYDRRWQDAQSIGTRETYLEKNGASFPAAQSSADLANIDGCVENVAAIRRMCEAAGTQLIVVLAPESQSQVEGYRAQSLDRFYSQLAQTGEYWNFSISSLSYDERYFYDSTHARNAVGSMVLAKIFGNDDLYVPQGFGVLCGGGECPTAEELKASANGSQTDEATVPILLYHHLVEEGEESDATLWVENFARQMELLKENGYQPVTFADLIAFVERGTPLPERPVVITFDDGYLSNYAYAFPILQRYEFPATIFVIGCSIGHDQFYKDTEYPITPHFGKAEIQEMTDSGLISIESHTYDMHQWPPYEQTQPARETIVPFAQESEEAYCAALRADVAQQNAAFAEAGLSESHVLAFPKGQHVTLTDAVLRDCGYRVTVTIDSTRTNTLVSGLPQSLIDLGRLTVCGDTSDEEILAYLAQ